LALLLAWLLHGLTGRHLRQAGTALLAVCFALGVLHNLAAWTANSRVTRQFLADLTRLEPQPPPRSVFVFQDLPLQIRGVRFFLRGLPEAVQLQYRRADLAAR